MTWRKRRGTITILVAAMLVFAVAGRLFRRTPRRAAPAGPYTHPITPSPPVVNPPPPHCRAADLRSTTAFLRRLRDDAAAAARERSARSCREDPGAQVMHARIDMAAQAASACVARDAELDGRWNQVQSAVLALQGCADCTAASSARLKDCGEAGPLIDGAEAGLP